jgi:hypothetical protein
MIRCIGDAVRTKLWFIDEHATTSWAGAACAVDTASSLAFLSEKENVPTSERYPASLWIAYKSSLWDIPCVAFKNAVSEPDAEILKKAS